jgi:hypothetical protein
MIASETIRLMPVDWCYFLCSLLRPQITTESCLQGTLHL